MATLRAKGRPRRGVSSSNIWNQLPQKSLTKKHRRFLTLLHSSFRRSKRLGRQLIRQANPGQIQAIGEVAYNILQGKLSPTALSKRQLSQLKKNKTILRYLASKRVTSLNKQRKLVNQTGSGLPILATLLAPLFTSLAGSAVSSLVSK